MPHLPDRRAGRSGRNRPPPIGAARYRWRSAPEPSRRPRPAPPRVRSGGSRGHSLVVVVPARTNRRISGSTLDGYSSRSQPVLRDVRGVWAAAPEGVKRPRAAPGGRRGPRRPACTASTAGSRRHRPGEARPPRIRDRRRRPRRAVPRAACRRRPRVGGVLPRHSSALRYGRVVVMAENASPTARMRATSGMSSPASRADSHDRPSARGGGGRRLGSARRWQVADDHVAERHVLLDDRRTRRRSAPGLAQDVVRDADLADVMEQSGHPQDAAQLRVELQPLGQEDARSERRPPSDAWCSGPWCRPRGSAPGRRRMSGARRCLGFATGETDRVAAARLGLRAA